jgi:hypothetical protein
MFGSLQQGYSEFKEFVPNNFTVWMNPDEIESLLENSEADINISNSHRALTVGLTCQ